MTKCFCGSDVFYYYDKWDTEDVHGYKHVCAERGYICGECNAYYPEDRYMILSMVQKIEAGDSPIEAWGIDLS